MLPRLGSRLVRRLDLSGELDQPSSIMPCPCRCPCRNRKENSARRGTRSHPHGCGCRGISCWSIHPRRLGIRGPPVPIRAPMQARATPPRRDGPGSVSRASSGSGSREAGCSLGQGTNAMSASARALPLVLVDRRRAIGPACSQPRQGDEQRVAVTRRHLGRFCEAFSSTAGDALCLSVSLSSVCGIPEPRPANSQSVPVDGSEGLSRPRVVGELDDGAVR